MFPYGAHGHVPKPDLKMSVDDLALTLKPFEVTCADQSALASLWARWLRSFRLVLDAKGITQDVRKKALLLRMAGEPIIDIWETLPEYEVTAEAPETQYGMCVQALTDYFTKLKCNLFERYKFRVQKQGVGETCTQYLFRLQTSIKVTDFDKVDREVLDMLVATTHSKELRDKLLSLGDAITIQSAVGKIREVENTQTQSDIIAANADNGPTTVAKVSTKQSGGKTQLGFCFRCGSKYHYGRDAACPAINEECLACGRVGHFARLCKGQGSSTRGKQPVTAAPEQQSGMKQSRNRQSVKNRPTYHKKELKQIELQGEEESNYDDDQSNDDDDYTFQISGINAVSDEDAVTVEVGGVSLKFMIDSGASVNVIDRNTWEYCKGKKIRCKSSGSDKQLYPYGAEPIQVVGKFTTQAEIAGKSAEAVFYVVDCKGISLLSKKTSRELGVLRLGMPLNHVTSKPVSKPPATADVSRKIIKENTVLKDKIRSDFPQVFTGLGRLKDFKLKLGIKPGVVPVRQATRKVPIHLQPLLEDKLKDKIKKGIIEEVNSPAAWVSPLVIAYRKNGDIRDCMDAREVNTAIEREVHPIPSMESLVSKLQNATVFSVLDMNEAFNQIELDEESRGITTFITHQGMFRYTSLFYGLNCAPEKFQKVMEQTIAKCKGVANYIDDFIVWGRDEDEHNKRLHNVLETFKTQGLTLNWKKCVIGVSEVQFRGHLFSAEGVKPLHNRVEAVLKFREPTSKSEVASLLGLAGYSSRFIANYSAVIKPLRDLLRNDTEFAWSQDQRNAFTKLVQCMTKPPVLAYFRRNAPTYIITDASPYAIAAVLVQLQDGEHRIVEYASRALTEVETRYSQVEREALGLVWACERFSFYVLGTKFTLVTDCKPLEFIFAKRSKPCARIERWVMRLQSFNYNILHQPGKGNIADPLSRLLEITETPKSTGTEDLYVRLVATHASHEPSALSLEDVQRESANDQVACQLREALRTDAWPAELKNFQIIKHELCSYGNVVLRGTRIFIPSSLRQTVLQAAHEGHGGIVSTRVRLRSKVWWPGLDKDAEKICRSCHGCQLVGSPDPPEPMARTELPQGPWEDVGIDYLGPLPSGECVLAIVDYYSRYVEAVVTRSTTSQRTIELLEDIFARHGYPVSMRSDNGPQFASKEFAEFCRINGVALLRTTPRWPQANGEIERQNRSLMKRLKIAHAEGDTVRHALTKFLFAYRTTVHSTTGVTPSYLMFNRELRDKIPSIQHSKRVPDEAIRDRDAEQKGKGKLYSDARRHAAPSNVAVGDVVLVKQPITHKCSTPFSPVPFKVTAREGNAVTIQSPSGATYRRNTTFVKRYVTPEPAAVEPEPAAVEPPVLEVDVPEGVDNGSTPILRRSQREHRKPARFLD